MNNRLVAVLAFITAIGASYFVGYTMNDDTTGYTGSTEVTDAVLLEVMDELINNHFSQPTEEQLLEGAVLGMIESLDDPHTTYFDYEAYSSYQGNFGETYVGIGVTVRFQDDLIIIEAVKDNGPADTAGILPNDIITHVDNELITDDNLYDLFYSIIGDEGTDVTIGVYRQGVPETIHLTMTRGIIENSSVKFETFVRGDKTFGYIEVTTFGDETADLFRAAISSLEEIGIDGLVVDLRDNGGGHLSTVYDMLNQFLINNGTEMFSTEWYDGGEYRVTEYHANNTTLKEYNIVTVVNDNSASASEVFASSMQEQGHFTIIGTQTYGKGTMQVDKQVDSTVSDLIHISIGKWITSDGNWVHFDGGTDGVTPDVIVEKTNMELAYKLFLFNDETLEFDQVDYRIENLQLILNIMGYTVRTDGYFDTATEDAIKAIQTANLLVDNGIVDNDTLSILNQALDEYQDNRMNDTQLQEALDFLEENPIID